MPKMTKAHHARHATLKAKLDRAGNAVYAVMHPRRDVRFSDCYAAAPENVKAAYEAARQALADFEYQMVAECRAWRAPYGLTSY